MAQVTDYTVSNQTFPNTRADINSIFEAIGTNNSGTTPPTNQLAGQFWIDTTSSTWTLYIHDGTDDIQFATIDTSANTVNFIDSALDVVTDTTPQLGGDLDLNSNDITGTGNINITGTATVSGDLTVDTNTLFVDASENTVVIGGTDATSWNTNADDLVVAGGSSGGMTFYNPTQTNIFFADGTTGDDVSRGRIQYVHSDNSFRFGTDVSERMRIDSSGNVLVDKTSSNYQTVGHELRDGGRAFHTADGGKTLSLNRLTSDGGILDFYKDGTEVGSIGTFSGEFYVGGTQSSRTGLIFGINEITPTQNDGTVADSIRNLGSSTARWKNIYLGGGAVISEATLTDGATISWDVSTKSVAKVTLGGNRTLSAPSNALDEGQFISLLVIQDGTGSRTLTWNAVYEFASDTAPTLTTTGGKGDLFVFRYNGTKWLEVGRNLNLSLS